MLNSETSFHRNAADKAAPATSQSDSVSYIRDMAVELQVLAKQSGFPTLAHLLSMAAMEATETAEKVRQSELV